MDPIPDLRALFAATAAVFLGVTVALAIAWRDLRDTPGLGRFAASFAIFVGGTTLLAARGRIPDLLSIVAGNLLVVLAAALIQEGTRLFYASRPQRGQTLASCCGSGAAFVYYTYAVPSSSARTALSSALIAYHLGQAAATSWRGRGRPGEELLARVTSAALAACAVVFAARTLLTLLGFERPGLFAANAQSAAALYLAMFSAVVWTTALLANANRRLVLRIVEIADARLRATRQQALLNRVLRIAARRATAAEIGARAADAIAEEGGWCHVTVAVPGEDGRFKLLGAPAGLSGVHLEIGGGVIGRAFATRLTQLVPDVARDPDYVERMARARSELAVPVRHAERTLGVLNLESPSLDGFTAADVELAEALAEAIGLGLENARLWAAHKDLTRALVHDLRAPMIGVLGALKLLGRSEAPTPEDRGLLEMARRNAERQTGLIEAILDVGRLEDGALPLRPSRVPLSPLIAEILRLATPVALGRGIPLLSDVPEQLPPAWVDRGLLARVLENLVGNAIKFSPEGAGPVKVAAETSVPGRILLRVSDSGRGIGAAQRARLFHKFSRGDERESGSGLGLAFCRLAVEASGGRIWLDETHAPGAAFVLSLPTAPTSLETAEGEPVSSGEARRGPA